MTAPPYKDSVAQSPARSRFYIGMGLVGLVAVAVGFFGTYFRPMAAGTFHAPAIVHLHGAFALAWVLIFALQPWLIRREAVRVHRAVGVAGVLVALGAAITIVPAQWLASTREAEAGGDMARAMVLAATTSALQFAVLVLAGALFVRRPTIHKRLMLLATIVLLWPAWFRWRHLLPWVPSPEIWLGAVLPDSLIIVAWLRDRFTRGHIQPVLLNVGLLLMLSHSLELWFLGHPRWVELGTALYHALTPIVAAFL